MPDKSLKILLLAQHFSPEEVSGAVLATELATELVNQGHQVSFVTCAPNYPYGQVFPGYKNKFLQKEKLLGVDVIRVWSYISPSKGFWSRILNYISFSAFAFFGGLSAEKPDVIFSYSPPLFLGITASILSAVLRVPWVLRIEDLYPDAAIAAGVLRNQRVINILFWLEKFIYNRAKHISLISEGFRKNLLQKGIAAGKLSVTPVWANVDEIVPGQSGDDFRKRAGVAGQFVLLYAGNLGQTSALEDILEAAALLKSNREISFVIVGEGTKKETLQAQAAREQLDNVIFLPFQARELYPAMLAAADVGLVTLNPQSSPYSLPSKTFNIMASERPVLAVVPQNSELADLVTRNHCGVVCPPGNPAYLAEKVLEMMVRKDEFKELGKNGRRAVEHTYSKDNCIGAFEKTLKGLKND